MMSASSHGRPPRHGWAPLVAEILVTDLTASLRFWRELLGFTIAYQRQVEGFVYLEREEGGQIMLCERHGGFETGPMQPPLGRGAMFQVYVTDVRGIIARLAAAKWPLYRQPREIWRRTGNVESGQYEVFVQDPDGYLLMIAQSIGERPTSE